MVDRRLRALTRVCVAGFFITLAIAARASAQAEHAPNLSALLPELILREIQLPTPTTPGLSHAAHFSPFSVNELQNPAVAIVESFNKLTVVQLSTFPMGSSSGGFSYAFDPTLGTFKRSTSSFGPLFAERASTLGRGRFSAGFNYQHASYDKFEGSSLDDGSIKFYLRHQECCSTSGPAVPPFFGVVEQPDGTLLNPFFEGDVIEAALSLNVATDVVSIFGNYGLTDRWDVGVAVPFVHVDMDASVLATIKRLATNPNTLIHTFVAGQDVPQTTFSSSGSATGIGDIELRTKYRLFDFPAGGLAAAVDFRMPTGNEDELLGGSMQVKLFVAESSGNDRITQHLNAGYTFSKDTGTTPVAGQVGATPTFPDEFNYAAGVEFVAAPRVTIIGDIVGRTLRDAGRLDLVSKTFQFQPSGNPAPPIASMQFDEFEPRSGNLNLLYGTAGVKFNPTGNILISASVLFPLTDSGLKNRLTTIVGMDYAF
jgi:Putative MetA-pathway of phenol degradation